MRSVTLDELKKWLKKNAHRTWAFDNFHPDKKDRTLQIKYLTFSLDTRDMRVWVVGFEGLGNREVAKAIRDTNDNDGKTILDELDEKLKE